MGSCRGCLVSTAHKGGGGGGGGGGGIYTPGCKSG